jgi:hypothetical protein
VLHLREEGRAAVGVPVLVGSYATEINLSPNRRPALIAGADLGDLMVDWFKPR